MTTTAPSSKEVTSQRRVRAGVRAVLTLGIVASLAANVAHAEATWTGRLIAGWSPLALALTVELGSRVPLTRSVRAVIRWLATAVIAGIAAWVSYWHMVSVALRHGEGPTSAHLIPLSVDGLVVVASVCLVEISDRLRTTADLASARNEHAPDAIPSPSSPGSSSATSRPSSSGTSPDSSQGSSTSEPGTARASSSSSSRRSSSRSPSRVRPADDETLRALVARARAERPRAGEPTVRRLLVAEGLSASSARIRTALAAARAQRDDDEETPDRAA
ncbi:MAG: hypothetical protein QG597_4726 [Actinomycetota bacterium]|nr:hypothetical protein [Actinomycetota bacterium]